MQHLQGVCHTASPPREAAYNSLAYAASLCRTLPATAVPWDYSAKSTQLKERIYAAIAAMGQADLAVVCIGRS